MKLLALALFAVLGVLGFAATATALVTASTTVSIRAQGVDLSGFVRSSNPQRCANNRSVTVFKQKGRTQEPGTDRRIGSDTASLNGTRYMWSTGNTGVSGKFYARAGRIRGCAADSSRTISATR